LSAAKALLSMRASSRARPLAKKADIATYHDMVKTAGERVEKLFNEGKTEADVIAADPLKDLILRRQRTTKPPPVTAYSDHVDVRFGRSSRL
jgi:S1-C subfamily serine protease